jgi:hypothetical protein
MEEIIINNYNFIIIRSYLFFKPITIFKNKITTTNEYSNKKIKITNNN